MGLKTFDPKGVSITMGGGIATGFADGTFVAVERVEDAFTESAGPDSEVVRVASNNPITLVTLTLMQSSDFNSFLSALHQLDIRLGQGVVPFALKEIEGDTLVIGGRAYIRKFANIEYGKEISNREWIIVVADAEMFVGGNVVSGLIP